MINLKLLEINLKLPDTSIQKKFTKKEGYKGYKYKDTKEIKDAKDM